MIEWRKLPRSIRYETSEYALDVWAYCESYGKVWKYTVYDKINAHYIDNGNASTEDAACEYALRSIKK